MKRGRKSTEELGLVLSNREKEILDQLGLGRKYCEVGEKFFISTETVRRHATNIYSKLDARNRFEAVVKFYLC